ncbi:MAG: hypothetical protein JSV23_10740 [Promethearchaeota archaeon]|nr:MAG: hypothetical protein JSV23_10740 [Candidatus Lokiarchaeota archaeon]
MTSKKYLSDKKTSQQTISISPALKDWIKRYVNVNHKKNPNDERFQSVSAFYNYIMENILELFKKGKTLDDFARVEDKEVKDFFEPFTFRATIPLYEMVSESNRYTPFSFEFTTRFLLTYLNFLKRQFRSQNYDDLRILYERLRTRVNLSNISKEWNLEIIPDENNRPAQGVLEFIGTQRNLHYENCKFFAAVLGMLGIKVTDFIYSPTDYYCRLDLLETDLLFKKELAKKERIKLLNENIEYIVNYNRMLDDKDKYLWMNLAEDNDLFISFKSENAFTKWIRSIEKDLQKFGTKEDFLSKLLLFFNKIHWIRIENLKDLSFQVEQSIEKNLEQKQLLLNYLSNYTEISQKEGLYYLKLLTINTSL